MRYFLGILGLTLLSGCTSLHVEPLHKDYKASIKSLCVEHNPKVYVQGFEPALVNRLETYRIAVQLYEGKKPVQCQYSLKYTADEVWETVMLLNAAELKVFDGNRRIAFAEYKLYRNGGLDVSKYQSNEAKINRLVDQLMLLH